MTGPSYEVESAELNKITGHLDDASSELGMRDFSDQASLERAVTLSQSISPHENIEETVEEALVKLTEFIGVHYKQSTQAVQDFIDRAHDEIAHVNEAVRQGKTGYERVEQENADIFKKIGPPDEN